jgi:hypothetical protein
MPAYLAAGFFAAVALALIVYRRQLGEMQSLVAGGTVPPGCVVIEGAIMLLLAVAAVVLQLSGLLG